MIPLILASSSVARARMLTAAGVTFQIVPAAVDEATLKHEFAAKGHDIVTTARSLAAAKAYSVGPASADALVLGADQILSLDGEIISKCTSPAEAPVLLRRLHGRTHELVTAAVLARNGVELWSHVNTSRMTMRSFSDDFLQEYIGRAGLALVQNVGCYELEGFGAQLFERMQGDFFSVLGLPLLPVLAALRAFGVIAE
jgi:septum formation protein